MANLNFTRNLPGNGLRSSVGGYGSPMSGHVTPVFGQRAPNDRRGIPNMGGSTTNQMGNSSNMNSSTSATLGPQYSSFNSSVFGSGDATNNPPPYLDLSEFPSLTSNSHHHHHNSHHHNHHHNNHHHHHRTGAGGGGSGGIGGGGLGGLGSSGGGSGGGGGGGTTSGGDSVVTNNSSIAGSVGGVVVGGGGLTQPSPMPGAKPYVGMVKQPISEASEFQMSSEDFPALPGTQHQQQQQQLPNNRDGLSPGGAIIGGGMGVSSSSSGGNNNTMTNSMTTVVGGGGGGSRGGLVLGGVENNNSSNSNSTNAAAQVAAAATGGSGGGGSGDGSSTTTRGGGNGGDASVTTADQKSSRTGIQTSPDGRVTNIPGSMVSDQFGIVGLLTFIRAAETDPNLVSLALGQDLTALGLNLNSPDNLYPTFGGPWAEYPLRPQDIDFHVPPEYLINQAIRDKLASMKLSRYKDDLLFFMFYNSVGDVLQLAAASELYSREWRYHMEEKVWITQVPGMVLSEKTATYERGTYFFFDAQNWRKVPKEFHLDYSKLEGRPVISQQNLHNAS